MSTTVASTELLKCIPAKYEGYILKKKKWPMKGWHRRYFLLESGFLKYAKSPHAISKNKLHGVMDIGLSVMSTKKNALTIDLDAEDTIFHLKLKTDNLYQLWLSKLRLHRDFRVLELKKDATLTHHINIGSEAFASPTLSPTAKEKDFVANEEPTIDACSENLSKAHQQVKLLEQMVPELHETSSHVVSALLTASLPASPNLLKKDKERKSKKVSKKSKNSINSMPSCESVISLPTDTPAATPNYLYADGFKIPEPLEGNQSLSRSNPDLTRLTLSTKVSPAEDEWSKPPVQVSKSVQSTPVHMKINRASTTSESSNISNPLSAVINEFADKQRRFVATASALQKSFSLLLIDIKQLEEAKHSQSKLVTMANAISQLTTENHDLRSRLQRIHNESSFTESGVPSQTHLMKRRLTSKTLLGQFLSESQLSISESVSDLFYDAEEYLLSDEGSTTSDEESETCDDEVSSDAELSDESETTSLRSLPYEVEEISSPSLTHHRTTLPCNRPDTDVSLWNILKKNIGKDLSKVAMPVTLNEPLNAMQLLCEELEYSDLLVQADSCDNIYEQMIYVAAFAISAYGSTYTRAGQKPFNPILGETYEFISDDKSYRFVSEQVSHHPPISACHCEGDHFQFWQDARFKNKFWGKSMEIFPVGSVHVRLKRHNRHFQWKKVTSCVHNIMAGTRWVEHYGDMNIACDDDVSCKIVFSKSGYWSGKSGEVSGSVLDGDGKVRGKVQGKWFDSVTCEFGGRMKTLWKANPMPVDHEKQYGFTHFAIQLNELRPDQVEFLPRTDSRFRPDQRCLENGDISGAEAQKVRVEQLQRDQKKKRDNDGVEYKPLFFTKINKRSDEEGWAYKGDYWELRQDPGFKSIDKIPVLW